MDPPSLVSQGPLPEMWQFPTVGVPPSGPRVGRMVPGPEVAAVGNRDVSLDESTVTEQSGGSLGRRKRRDSASEDESSKLASTSSGNDLTDSEVKRLKVIKSTNETSNLKMEAEASSGICNKTVDQNPPPAEPAKQDYIHVRARRGQATDSHSLAERARREKISERMKILQDLVPGCNKVIGKASVLDEIINYIQALQRQVEFLSMKLEAVNSRINAGIEGFPPKDFGAQTYDTTSNLAFDTQPAREYGQGSVTEWLHMQKLQMIAWSTFPALPSPLETLWSSWSSSLQNRIQLLAWDCFVPTFFGVRGKKGTSKSFISKQFAPSW